MTAYSAWIYMKRIGLAFAIFVLPLSAQTVAICHAVSFLQAGAGPGIPLRAEYRTQAGNLAAKAWTWRSGDTTIAQVSSIGVVIGVRPGLTWVEARTGTRTAKACVRIIAGPVSTPSSAATRRTARIGAR